MRVIGSIAVFHDQLNQVGDVMAVGKVNFMIRLRKNTCKQLHVLYKYLQMAEVNLNIVTLSAETCYRIAAIYLTFKNGENDVTKREVC
jgi:hypothetical protein